MLPQLPSMLQQQQSLWIMYCELVHFLDFSVLEYRKGMIPTVVW